MQMILTFLTFSKINDLDNVAGLLTWGKNIHLLGVVISENENYSAHLATTRWNIEFCISAEFA